MPSYETIEDWLTAVVRPDEPVDDLRVCARWLLARGYTEIADAYVRTGTVREALAGRVDSEVLALLHRLSEEAIVVRLDPPGADRFIVHERADAVFFDPRDPEFARLLDEEIARLIAGLNRSQPHARRAVARAIGHPQDAIDEALSSPDDPLERLARFRTAFAAVDREIHEVANVGRIGWRRRPYRWALSRLATRIAENESLPLR